MGGFFSPDTSSTPAVVVASTTTTDTSATEAEDRLDVVNRNRRGMAGTIATSESGLLQAGTARAGKSLLGE